MTPTLSEAMEKIADHYGITVGEVLAALNGPTHPASLRDEFAGQAMQGLLAGEMVRHPPSVAGEAYRIANAMLKERIG